MKEIYFGSRFDNLYSIFSAMSSTRLCRCCVPLFSLLFHNFFSISSTCLLWWCWDKILGQPQVLKWFIAIETCCSMAVKLSHIQIFNFVIYNFMAGHFRDTNVTWGDKSTCQRRQRLITVLRSSLLFPLWCELSQKLQPQLSGAKLARRWLRPLNYGL